MEISSRRRSRSPLWQAYSASTLLPTCFVWKFGSYRKHSVATHIR
jgi:hypothetical protein